MLDKTELRILMLGKNNFEKFPIGVRSVRTLWLVRCLSTCSSVCSYALSWINEGPTSRLNFEVFEPSGWFVGFLHCSSVCSYALSWINEGPTSRLNFEVFEPSGWFVGFLHCSSVCSYALSWMYEGRCFLTMFNFETSRLEFEVSNPLVGSLTFLHFSSVCSYALSWMAEGRRLFRRLCPTSKHFPNRVRSVRTRWLARWLFDIAAVCVHTHCPRWRKALWPLVDSHQRLRAPWLRDL